MSKITRKIQKIFGSSAGVNQIAEFGSLAASAPVFTTDPATIQSLSNYLTGWFGAVIGSNSPAIEDMNALCYLYAYQLAYLMQNGIAEWETGTTYFKGSLVTSGNVVYISRTDTNSGNAVTDTTNWTVAASSSNEIVGIGITATVGTNALTVSLVDPYGTTLTANTSAIMGFRDPTLTNGQYVAVLLSGAASLTVASGATLGTISAANEILYVYAINNAGTIEAAISRSVFDEGTTVSTTALSGSSNSGSVMYSTTARSNVACRLVGRIKIKETTAGTWATSPTELALAPFQTYPLNTVTFFQSIGSGGSAGTFTSGSFINRVLNSNSPTTLPSWVSISGSTDIALLAGTYFIEGEAQAYGVDRHQTQLYNSTDSATALVGSSAASGSADTTTSTSFVSGYLTISATKTIQFQHRCATTGGLGIDLSFGINYIIALLKITKII